MDSEGVPLIGTPRGIASAPRDKFAAEIVGLWKSQPSLCANGPIVLGNRIYSMAAEPSVEAADISPHVNP
jgi:hypothetical protein